MKLNNKVLAVICFGIVGVVAGVNATNIEPPTGSEVFVSNKILIDENTSNGSFETGVMNPWSRVDGTVNITNEIPAAAGEYYARLVAWDTDTRADCRMDNYYRRTATSPADGNIFKVSASIYFPSASGNEEPADAFLLIYGLNDGVDWLETLGDVGYYKENYESNKWYTVEYYAQTTQEVFTGISPRISHYTYGIDTNKVYVGLIDNIVVEQGVYKQLGTLVMIQ